MRRASRHITRVGVTGGIGSGKSLVCKVFADRGIPVLSADEIAKDLSNSNPALRKRIAALLGDEAYTPEGPLNRSLVSDRIFSDKHLQQRLNSIVHPAVEDEIRKRISALERDGVYLVIVEAALIYEAGLDEKLDAVIVVDAEEKERIRRVRGRDRVSEKEVRRRIAAQWPMEKKIKMADFVLVNNGTIDDLTEKTIFLYSILSKMNERRSKNEQQPV